MFIIMIANMNNVDIIKYDSHDISVECNNSTLIIRYPNITYSYFKSIQPYDDDEDLMYILADILVSLDCSVTFSNMRLISVGNMNYDRYVSDYYYYMLHIEDVYLYNICFDALISRHESNVQFELDNPIVKHEPKVKTKKIVKAKGSNKFVRQVTTDLITNEETYIYSNSKTGEVINSSDPNLLDGLNGVKPKKEKRVKSVGVPMSSMTFTFKKKND